MIKSRATSQTKLREQVQILHLIVGRLIYEANYHPRIQVVSDVDTMSIPFRPRVFLYYITTSLPCQPLCGFGVGISHGGTIPPLPLPGLVGSGHGWIVMGDVFAIFIVFLCWCFFCQQHYIKGCSECQGVGWISSGSTSSSMS